MENCPRVAPYTAVASIYDSRRVVYTNDGFVQSGIFIECVPQGFMVCVIAIAWICNGNILAHLSTECSG